MSVHTILAQVGPPAPLVKEALPYAAQYGILGLLCLVLACAVVYLVLRLDRMHTVHALKVEALHVAQTTKLQDLHVAHSAKLDALHLAHSAKVELYAKSLAELMGPVQEVVCSIEEIAKAVEDRRRR